MAVAKRRKSKARVGMRRSAWMASVKTPQTVPCPNCQAPKLPHRVCKECGQYNGRPVIAVDEEE